MRTGNLLNTISIRTLLNLIRSFQCFMRRYSYSFAHESITISNFRSDYAEGWYQDENGDWYQADPTEGKKPSTTGKILTQ